MVCDPAYKDLSILTKKFRFGVPNPRQLHVQGVFSGNLSLDVAKSSKWNISRGGLFGMRPKKMNTE
ncbi:hypothetical protein NC653_001816 [Populus alba x Populus x berolinensis]|uniref:Uncharacterized protein n=1 Tax=Populus alba x Populus x berolinensis TaxID=444605 RepID=A0AAD6WGG9_9ROSI|nr:hypothetical protein NC653_001816 [Populus alba x Populus x berolinensis]